MVINAQNVVQNFTAVLTLELDVVNRKDGLDVAVPRTAVVIQSVVHRNECRLPVIAVDDIRMEINGRQHFQNCAGEKGKALRVIILSIYAVSCEIVLIIQEIVLYAVRFIHKDAAVLAAPCNLHIQISQVVHLIAPLRLNLAVQRADHGNLVSLCRQRLRQRTCHIAQTAGFDKRRYLACCIQYLHI